MEPGQHRRQYLRNSPPKSAGRSESSPHSRKPPRKQSKKRFAEVTRTMGSDDRRRHVRGLPCSACGVEGFSVNAHLLGVEGMSLKKPAETIGPLCADRIGVEGCHALYDRRRWEFDARFPDYDAVAVAAQTQSRWAAQCEAAGQRTTEML